MSKEVNQSPAKKAFKICKQMAIKNPDLIFFLDKKVFSNSLSVDENVLMFKYVACSAIPQKNVGLSEEEKNHADKLLVESRLFRSEIDNYLDQLISEVDIDAKEEDGNFEFEESDDFEPENYENEMDRELKIPAVRDYMDSMMGGISIANLGERYKHNKYKIGVLFLENVNHFRDELPLPAENKVPYIDNLTPEHNQLLFEYMSTLSIVKPEQELPFEKQGEVNHLLKRDAFFRAAVLQKFDLIAEKAADTGFLLDLNSQDEYVKSEYHERLRVFRHSMPEFEGTAKDQTNAVLRIAQLDKRLN